MTATLQLLLLAASVTYIVDVSGFTESWRALLARMLHIRPENLRPLPPFDCGKCATFWAVLLWGCSAAASNSFPRSPTPAPPPCSRNHFAPL